MSEAVVDVEPAVSHRQNARMDLKRVKMLLVDDNPQALDILVQALLGFCVRSPTRARSYEAAVEFLASDTFDVVIVDGEMPGKDGFDLTEMIRANTESPNYTVPIMILSSYTPRQKIIRARDVGANVVVTKPVVPGVLLARLEWLAKHPRQFVISPNYSGPDRRFKKVPLPEGIPERRADTLRLTAQPERAMSQNEIDSIFG